MVDISRTQLAPGILEATLHLVAVVHQRLSRETNGQVNPVFAAKRLSEGICTQRPAAVPPTVRIPDHFMGEIEVIKEVGE